MFRINLTDPLAKVSEYLTVLGSVNYTKLKFRFNDYTQLAFSTPRHPLFKRLRVIQEIEKPELRTLHTCCLLHPKHYHESGEWAPNWYDIDEIASRLLRGDPIYHDKERKLEIYFSQQKPFIQRIWAAEYPFKIEEDSLERYEQFMSLVKKYGHEKKLSPPLDVDIVWHAHMLHHSAYVEASKEHFGYILDHDDSERPNGELEKQKEETSKLWVKHYGSCSDSSLSPSGCGTVLPFFAMNSLLLQQSYPSWHSRMNNTSTEDDSLDNGYDDSGDSSCSSCSSCS